MTSIAAPEHLVVPAISEHTATVIFIHGLGDNGHSWKFLADQFGADPNLSHIKWVLPHAPRRAITGNSGAEMPSWYDVYSFDLGNHDAPQDESGTLASSQSLSQLIVAETQAGIDEHRIVLAGFSQGGAMSLLTGLQPGRNLAGVVCLSARLPLRNKFVQIASPEASNTPIFWGQGTLDPLITLQLVEDSIELLTKELGFTCRKNSKEYKKGIAYNVYDGLRHSTSQQEFEDLKAWLIQALPKN